MGILRIEKSAQINAPADRVFAIIADYHNDHGHILPEQYFSSLQVEQGGKGAGTIVRFTMRALGTTREIHAAISEPEPGRVLLETDLDTGTRTTFTVDPVGDGGRNENRQRVQVTITTEMEAPTGIFGWLEGLITRLFLRRVYTQELELLAAHAESAGG